MWFKKLLIKLVKKSPICYKCNSPSNGDIMCEKCQEYLDDIELKKQEDIKAKEALKIRSWIKTRDEFLDKKNGR